MKIDPSYPLVSIITRTRNRPVLFRRAKESVNGLAYENVEWVVVNDGGEPAEIDRILEDCSKRFSRLVVLHNKESVGMEAASNLGVKNSSGKYVLIHDDDDSLHPDSISKMVDFLEGSERFDGVVCRTLEHHEIYHDNRFVTVRTIDMNPNLETVAFKDLCSRNQYPPISFLYKRQVYESIKGYDESMPVLGDWDFNLRFLLQANIGVLPQPLAHYYKRIESNNPGDAFSNSVIAQAELHKEIENRWWNEHMRNYLATNNDPLGKLFSLHVGHKEPSRYGKILRKIKKNIMNGYYRLLIAKVKVLNRM